MGEYLIHAGVAIYWSFAVIVYMGLLRLDHPQVKPYEAIGASLIWPVLAVLGVIAVLWRIPFKTVRQMRQDIRSKGQWKEYQRWLETRKDATNDQ